MIYVSSSSSSLYESGLLYRYSSLGIGLSKVRTTNSSRKRSTGGRMKTFFRRYFCPKDYSSLRVTISFIVSKLVVVAFLIKKQELCFEDLESSWKTPINMRSPFSSWGAYARCMGGFELEQPTN